MPITLLAQDLTINAVGGVLDSRNPTGAAANREPVWTPPASAIQLPQGSVVSIASYASDPDGDAITFARAGGTAPAGITVLPNGSLVVATDVAEGTYTVIVDADDGRI